MIHLPTRRNQIIDSQRQQRHREALMLTQEALQDFPADPFLLTSEVHLLLRTGQVAEARQKAELHWDRLKDNAFFIKTYVIILKKQKDFSGIRDLVTREVLPPEYGENPPEGTPCQKYATQFQNHPPLEAIAEIETLRELADYRSDADLLFYLAECYIKTQQYPKAIELYEQLLAARDSMYIRKKLGWVCYKANLWDPAIRYWEEVLIQEPQDYALRTAMFKMLSSQKDTATVERLVQKGLAANPQAKYLYAWKKKAQEWTSA
jgi:tetratricopeptide (TPR) repeat protein